MERKMKFTTLRIILCIALFLVAFFVSNISYLKLGLYIVSYLIIGFDVIKEAIENIFHGHFFDENFLMMIATIGAFATGEYPEAVAVMLLYQIGECFEDYAVDKSRASITNLMDIRPDYANVEKDGTLLEVHPSKVAINDIIIIKPGEKIPLDGVVIEGQSFLDTSSITGESSLKSVKSGSCVYSGTINQESMIKVKVTNKYEDSTVSKILELVENASDKKSKSETFISKFAKFYTPIVVILALLLAFVPPLLLKNVDIMEYIHRACSFLVISCPCALVISIPLGFFAGIGSASRKGILIKGSNYMESLAKIKTVLLDKTGTLTLGNFEVAEIFSINMSKEELLQYAAYAENYSKHPIASSIKKAYGKSIDSTDISHYSEIAGKGIEAIVKGKKIQIGNYLYLQSNKIPVEEKISSGTILYVAINHQYVGYIVVADKIKEEAKNAIDAFHQKHIHTIMLTGDSQVVADEVAKELSISEVHAELLPQDKVQQIELILSQSSKYGTTAFIGDGTNDAPVLIRADIGIAMGDIGSAAAIEAADVVIMDDNLTKINIAIQIAKKTLRIVKENIWFAIAIKCIVLILSAFGITTMWEAVFADVGVALLAILNSMRALK